MRFRRARAVLRGHQGAAFAVTFAFCIALTAGATMGQARANAKVAQLQFHQLTERVVARLGERLRTYEYGLLGARGAVIASGPDGISRERFALYGQSRDIDREFPGVRGIGVVWRVAERDEPAFVAAARRDGAPDFAVRTLAPHAGDRYVVTLVEPLARNRPALGVDLASEPDRRAAAETAMRSGAAALSAPIAFVDASGTGQHDFVLMLPIYRPGAPAATEVERVAATVGWTAAPLQMEKLLASVALDDRRLALALRDREEGGNAFFATPGGDEPAAGGIVRNMELPVYGRTWTVEMRARPLFLKEIEQTDPRAVAVFGALLSALAACLIYVLAQSSRREEKLHEEQGRRAAIVSSSSDAIIGETRDGIITDWNAGAERLFGHRAAEALGQPLAALLVPEGYESEHDLLRAAVARGESVLAFDTVRRHRSGTLLDVSVAASPILGPSGAFIGLAKTVRDISIAKRAELEVRELNASLERRVTERTLLLESARHDLQNILDAVPMLIGYCDKNLRNRVANRAYLDWFGISAEDVRGKHVTEILGPALFEKSRPYMEAALRGEQQTFERSMPRPDGLGSRESLAHYLPDVVDGEVKGFYIVVHDVSELMSGRRQLADALREKQVLLDTIQEHAICSVADRAGRIVDANEGFCRISGYSRDELMGQDHHIVNSGSHPPAFWSEMWRSISAGRPWRGEICNRAKDGSIYWVDSIIAAYSGADGAIEKYISIRFDITAAKRAEQELRANKAFLDRAGEVAGVGGWELDLRTLVLTWSDQTYRIHELPFGPTPSLDEALNFYAPEGRPLLQAAVARATQEGIQWDLELPFVTAKGRHMWVRAQGTADMEGGKPIRLVGAFQDITARKRAAALLEQAIERFAIAADSADIGVWEWELATNVLAWDDRMYRMYACVRSDAIEPYSVWANRLHPGDRQRAEAALQAALHGNVAFDTEFRIVWPDGTIRHLHANARVVRDAAGAPLRMTGVNIDITAGRRAELALVETASLLDTVLRSASQVSIIATDSQLNITVFNAGAQQLLGYDADEVVGVATPILIHDPVEVQRRAAELSEQLGRAVEGGAVFTEPSILGIPRDWTYVRKDGTRTQVSLVVTAMQAADGSLLGYLGIAHDVTSQRRYEESLHEAMRKARHASLAKGQFLANMSHEIRTPMNAVIGLTYLLGQTALDAEQAETVDKLGIAAKSLLGVINDVLDLSKIEAGELSLEQEPFAVHVLLREVSGMMAVQAEAKQIAFRVEAPADLPAALIGDAARLGQVLVNLVANAIKFTDRGGVTLGVGLLETPGGADPARPRLRFEVKDSGIGISPADQARLFSPFVQADASTKRRFGGTGLGLSIVKRVVGLMNGSVGLESTPGQGSTFWVELDFAVADPATLVPAAAAVSSTGSALRGVRVLITDDSEINLEVARRILELEGAKITLASHGQQAVDLLRTQPHAFDAVLMDVQMPGLDGYEATQRIRGELGLAWLPVIALTAGAMSSEHQRAAAVGMDDYVTKPFDARSLVRTLLRHVRLGEVSDEVLIAATPEAGAAADDTAWPEIKGIDTNDVRGRLGNDVGLFRLMLRRMLAESGDLLPQPGAAGAIDAGALRALAGRMHKLKGSAGMLGAQEISQLADQAETACRDGEVALALQLARSLALKLEHLHTRSAAALAPREDASEPVAPEATAEIDLQRLQGLIALLNEKSFNAIECFHELAPQLRRRLGDAAYGRVCEKMENLQFMEASDVLVQSAMPLSTQ